MKQTTYRFSSRKALRKTLGSMSEIWFLLMFLYKKKDEVSKWKFAAIDGEETVSQLTYSQEEQSWHATECTFQEVGDLVAW